MSLVGALMYAEVGGTDGQLTLRHCHACAVNMLCSAVTLGSAVLSLYAAAFDCCVALQMCFLAPQSAAQMLSFSVVSLLLGHAPDRGAMWNGTGLNPQFIGNKKMPTVGESTGLYRLLCIVAACSMAPLTYNTVSVVQTGSLRVSG